VPKAEQKGLNSLIILVAWEVWMHCNSCVFENATPSIQEVLRAVSTEGNLWCSAGARNLQELLVREPALGLYGRLFCLVDMNLVCGALVLVK
jgi:hypothetical protein